MRRLRWGLGLLGEVLLTLGVLLLLFVVWQLYWTDVEANRTQAHVIRTLEREFRGSLAPPASPAPGHALAILRVPRFGAGYARPVVEGTDHDALEAGVGHYAGTAPPGGIGNFAVAGHRTTYGRPFSDIDRLRAGDRIIVETRAGYLVYAVLRHEIVAPWDTAVIAPVPDHPGVAPQKRLLTMTACHPRYSAARRYVVVAELVARYARAEGLPASDLAVPSGGST